MRQAVDYESIEANWGTPVGLTSSIIGSYSDYKTKPPTRIIVTVEQSAARVRWDDGAANVSSEIGGGLLFDIGDSFEVDGLSNLENFYCVSNTATSTVIGVLYEREY